MSEYLGYPLPKGTRFAPHEIGGGYLYREDELLLDTRDRTGTGDTDVLQQVRAALADGRFRRRVAQDILAAQSLVADLPWHGDDRTQVDEIAAGLDLAADATPLAHGIVKLTLPRTTLTDHLVPILVARLSALEFEHGTTPPQVTPNHVLWGTGHGRPYAVCPPLPAKAPCPLPVAGEPPVRRVRIALLDGRVNPRHELFRRGSRSRIELLGDSEEGPVASGTELPAYAGHGDFMAGVVVTEAPEATVVAIRVLRDQDGTVDDDELAAGLDQVPDDVDIVLMCLGGYAHDNRAMPATAAALESLRQDWPHLLLVAGAGNDSVDTELFPAAFADVLGIGAVDGDGRRTCFTNFGPWVDACTDGSATVSAFVEATDVTPADRTHNCLGVQNPGEVDFTGYAIWRGTSVSAARFAGKVAAAMNAEIATRTAPPPTAREVAARMVFLATGDFVDGLGPRV